MQHTSRVQVAALILAAYAFGYISYEIRASFFTSYPPPTLQSEFATTFDGIRCSNPSPPRVVSRLVDKALFAGDGIARKFNVEHQVIEALLRTDDVIEPPPLSLDVGANRGVLSELLLEFGHEVIAFEPSSGNLKVLDEKFNGVDKLTIVRAAVGAEPAILEMQVFNNGSTSDSFVNQDFHGKYAGRDFSWVQVPVVRLDDVVPSDRNVHLLKTDTQGFELNVLRGAAGLLSAKRVRYIYAEFWPKSMRQNGQDPADVFRLLQCHGYFLYQVGGSHDQGHGLSLLREASDPSFERFVQQMEDGCPEEQRDFGCWTDILAVLYDY